MTETFPTGPLYNAGQVLARAVATGRDWTDTLCVAGPDGKLDAAELANRVARGQGASDLQAYAFIVDIRGQDLSGSLQSWLDRQALIHGGPSGGAEGGTTPQVPVPPKMGTTGDAGGGSQAGPSGGGDGTLTPQNPIKPKL